MRRGEVRWARLNPVEGHEQAGRRPVLVVSDNRFMMTRQLAIVFPISTNDRMRAPLAIELPSLKVRRSFALAGQIRTVALSRLGLVLCVATEQEMSACLGALLHLCGQAPKQRPENDA